MTKEYSEEYLKNNKGYIWVKPILDNAGNQRFTAIPWNYAVDSPYIMESKKCLIQLMSPEEKSQCVDYSRTLTRLIHEHVLYGRWDGNYNSDGCDPSVWVGSAQVLERWLQSRQRVRYAQCWVFAAVLTSILGASGIPARTVTNYNSHHDRGVMLDNFGNVMIRPYDSIVQQDEYLWNFHVWTEAWFARPDLGQPEN